MRDVQRQDAFGLDVTKLSSLLLPLPYGRGFEIVLRIGGVKTPPYIFTGQSAGQAPPYKSLDDR